MQTLLIVGGRPDTARKAAELGVRVVLVQHKELFDPAVSEHAEAVILVDYTDWAVTEPLVDAAHRVWSFSRAVSLADQGLEIVGRINDRFRLPGTPYRVSHLFRDKLAMRRHLATTGLGTVAAEPVRGPADVRAFAARHGYPVVLKPADGTGSRGVVIVEDAGQVERAWNVPGRLRGHRDGIGRYYPVDRLLAEEYVEGTEYAVETFSFGGRHVVVAVTEKLCAGVVEIGHAVPARLPAHEEEQLVAYVADFLDAMGLRDGISSTEVKMSPAGPRVIESQDRVSGDRVMDLVELAYGVDLERYAVGWPFGLVEALPGRPVARRGAATRFLLAAPGTVTAVNGREAVRGQHGFVDLEIGVGVGDEVAALADSFDRIGQLLTTGADTGEAVRICDELLSRVTVRTTAGPVTAGIPG
jgi:biotin carboxylase